MGNIVFATDIHDELARLRDFITVADMACSALDEDAARDALQTTLMHAHDMVMGLLTAVEHLNAHASPRQDNVAPRDGGPVRSPSRD